MASEPNTGIAGAMHHAQHAAGECYVCGKPCEASYAARAMPGFGIVGACSVACAAHDRFRTPEERLRAEMALMREIGDE